MSLDELPPESEATRDTAYPTNSVPDPLYPCQSLVPLSAPFDGIATPAIWSRLSGPLTAALQELWQLHGLLNRARPSRWITLHFGRIAVNAHGWERIRAHVERRSPDPTLIEPAASRLQQLPDLIERVRVQLRRRRRWHRLARASQLADTGLAHAAVRNPGELDSAELARGPLGERLWADLLLPWLARRLEHPGERAVDPSLGAAIGIEQSFAAELGRRLKARGLLSDESAIVYLTVSERIQAVHEDSDYWAKLASMRQERVERFVEVELPVEFWGRPRVEEKKTG